MKVRLYHPKLDVTVEVSERQARILERSGWKRAGEDAEVYEVQTAASDEPIASFTWPGDQRTEQFEEEEVGT